jgi:hypothetical protein
LLSFENVFIITIITVTSNQFEMGSILAKFFFGGSWEQQQQKPAIKIDHWDDSLWLEVQNTRRTRRAFNEPLLYQWELDDVVFHEEHIECARARAEYHKKQKRGIFEAARAREQKEEEEEEQERGNTMDWD